MLRITPRSARDRTVFTLFLALGLLAAPARSQEETPSAARQAVEEALRLAGQGDLRGAVAGLEALRQEGSAPAYALATLGALYVEADEPRDALEVLAPLAAAGDAPAAVLYNAGRAARALALLDEAEALLVRSLAQEPGTPAVRELGLVLGARRRYLEAYGLLLPWVRANPDDREARLAAVLCALQLRRAPEAEELLSSLPQSEPATGLLWGRLLLLQGEPHGAIAVLQPVLEQAPEEISLEVRRALAEAYLEVGESERAVSVLEGHTEGDPGSSLLLARARYQGGDVEGALATLGPFATPLLESEIDPDHPNRRLAGEIAREQGRWLLNSGRHDDALPYLRWATEAAPRDKEAWKALGQALAASGARSEAEEALARFQELAREEGTETERVNRARLQRDDPTAAALQRAQELLQAERAEEALAVVRAERQIGAGDLRPWLLESRILLVLGRHEEALSLAERALELAPGHPDALYQRGSALFALKRFPAAREDLERTLELAPGHVAAMSDLAVLLILQGEKERARTLLERVLELRPGDARARENLERLRAAG